MDLNVVGACVAFLIRVPALTFLKHPKQHFKHLSPLTSHMDFTHPMTVCFLFLSINLEFLLFPNVKSMMGRMPAFSSQVYKPLPPYYIQHFNYSHFEGLTEGLPALTLLPQDFPAVGLFTFYTAL